MVGRWIRPPERRTHCQIIGPVVDVEFGEGSLPDINTALQIHNDGQVITLEVANDLGNNSGRCVSVQPTDGLARGAEVIIQATRFWYRLARPS